jgi:xylulokinase
MHAIGIDVGSTNVKVVLVDDAGGIVADASRPLRTDTVGDAVSQDPDALWATVADAVRQVTGAAPDAAHDVATIGVCSQYSSLVPVDDEGRAVAPIKMYLDSRGADACWAILERHPDAFDTWVAHHGIPPIGGGLTLSHLLHFQLDEPDVHARTATYLEVMDLVNLRLTGTVTATQCTMFAAQLCDNRTVGVTEYDPELVAMSGVDADRLPPLIPVDGIVGEVVAEVAAELGLPTGVQVRAGMNDTQAGAFATGALADPARRGLMVGTTAVLIQSMPAMGVDLDHEILSMPVPVPGRYVVMAENGIAGRAVERALAVLSPASTTSEQQFAELEAALAASPTGASGVLFLPWLAGSMSPSASSEMRGGYLGMTLLTERADLLRATVEGVARNLRWLSPAVTELCGGAADDVMFAGGAARSPGVAQVLADVLGVPVVVPDRPEVTAARAVGAVALARTTGADPTATGATPARRDRPDPTATAVHDRLQPIFEAAFSANTPICQALGS